FGVGASAILPTQGALPRPWAVEWNPFGVKTAGRPHAEVRSVVQKKVLGLIGGIGSGKSTVAAEFAKCGGYVIAGDQLGHEALRQPSIKKQVLARWGPEIETDGEIDRRKLGRIVFADPKQRRELEALVHPWIK